MIRACCRSADLSSATSPAEALDHCPDQRLLKTARGLGVGDDRRSVLRQLSGSGVKALKFCHMTDNFLPPTPDWPRREW
jgi:hypothetical protein